MGGLMCMDGMDGWMDCMHGYMDRYIYKYIILQFLIKLIVFFF